MLFYKLKTKMVNCMNSIKYFFLKILKNPLTFILLIFFGFEIGAYYLFTNIEADGNIIAGTMTGLFIIFGYFITHYLEISRKEREKKFEQYLNLIKGLRILLIEDYTKSIDDDKELIDKLQNAYFESSVSISKKSYDKLHETITAFSEFAKTKNISDKRLFLKKQSDFINQVRSEFFIEQEINFETFTIKASDVNNTDKG